MGSRNNEKSITRDLKIDEDNSCKKLLAGILYLILAAPALFLLINNYPKFLVISFLAVILISIIFFLIRKVITSYHAKILGLLLILYLYFIFSFLLSNQKFIDLFKYSFLRNDGNFFFCYIMFFALAVPFFDYKRLSNIYFKFLFVVFSGFSLFALFIFLSKLSVFTIRMKYNTDDIFVALNFAHNATGSVYAMVSLFALVFFLKEKILKYKFVYLAVLIICVAGLFFTKSRGSYTGFAAGLVFILWMHFRSVKKFLITSSALIVIFIPIVYITGTWSRILQIFDFKEVNIAARFTYWAKAWYLFTKSPFFGIGYGRQNDIFPAMYDKLKGIPGLFTFYLQPAYFFNDSQAHNSYVQFLAETGVIGLGLLLLFWGLCFGILIRAYNSKFSSDYGKKIYLCGLGSIAALFVLSFTENYMSATTVMACISIVNSLAIGLAWQENARKLKVASESEQKLFSG